MTEAPSDTEVWSAGARTASLPDHLMVNEYCGEFFRCFLTDARLSPGEDHGAGQETDAAGGMHTSGKSNPAGGTDIRGGTNTGGQQAGAAYEMEYLIVGKDLDEENLGGTVARLLAVREGLNLIHILSDSQISQHQKYQYVKKAGRETDCGFSFPPALLYVYFLIL